MLVTPQQVRAIAASLATPELLIFPVRHHSPACAWQLQRVFDARRPSSVLIEGPRSFTPLVPLLASTEARMPLAVYSYAVMRPEGDGEPARRAAYYPFCDYSPELVAVREAAARSVETRFIDLDFAEQAQLDPAPDDLESQSMLDERHFRRSRFLTELARQQGCRDQEELWEQLFEAPATRLDLPRYLEGLTAYCHLARIECSETELRADGTLQREAEMAWHIREALARRAPGDGPVLAIVGGFHAVALPGLLRDPPPRPVIPRDRVTDESSALIRYSFDRLDLLNGYSAGMTSPAWHQVIWERMQGRGKASHDSATTARAQAAIQMVFEMADLLRTRHGVPLPMPALAAAHEQALRLAQLRRRAAPLRNDVLDGVVSAFVKGAVDAEGAPVLAVAHRVLGGVAVGKVPPGASRPPLVDDFEYRARRQRLRIDGPDPRRTVLEIYRRREHRVTSRLFHGLLSLGVPLGTRIAGPDFVRGAGLDRLQEHWQYSYSAATEAALVEASLWGVTVPLAVAAKYADRLGRLESGQEPHDAKLIAALTVQACVLGLHDHLPRVLGSLRRALGDDASFDSVAHAVFTLGLLWESREPLEARDVAELPALVRTAYERCMFLGQELRGASSEDQQGTLEALTRVRELLLSAAGRDLDSSLFWALVERLRERHESPLIRGGCTGLAHLGGRIGEQALGAIVAGQLGGAASATDAVAFLRGLLHCARETAWQQPELLGVLDGLVAQWDERAFVAVLPELRLAFATMTPNETDRIAAAVARLHGAESLGSLVSYDLSDAEVQRHLAWSAGVHEVLEADGLGTWLK